MKRAGILLVITVVALGILGLAPHAGRSLIRGGEFTPLYGMTNPDERVRVRPFVLDRFPVTNKQFLEFTKKTPQWRRSNAPELLSDARYLSHWTAGSGGIGAPRSEDLNRPVVNVSWFAANDFCLSAGGRLPSVLEWEFAAAANENVPDASRDPEFVQQILGWYAAPSGATALRAVGQSRPNYWGIFDLHGLIWEWTADFNSVMVTGDSRRSGEQLKDLFCGAGAVSSADKANYAAFMRYALRNSLQGKFTTENLGFRCAYDHTEE